MIVQKMYSEQWGAICAAGCEHAICAHRMDTQKVRVVYVALHNGQIICLPLAPHAHFAYRTICVRVCVTSDLISFDVAVHKMTVVAHILHILQ